MLQLLLLFFLYKKKKNRFPIIIILLSDFCVQINIVKIISHVSCECIADWAGFLSSHTPLLPTNNHPTNKEMTITWKHKSRKIRGWFNENHGWAIHCFSSFLYVIWFYVCVYIRGSLVLCSKLSLSLDYCFLCLLRLSYCFFSFF